MQFIQNGVFTALRDGFRRADAAIAVRDGIACTGVRLQPTLSEMLNAAARRVAETFELRPPTSGNGGI